MVPDRVSWESLGLFFAENFGVTPVASGDFLMVRAFSRGV